MQNQAGIPAGRVFMIYSKKLTLTGVQYPHHFAHIIRHFAQMKIF
jgi:hypothetical protein